MNEKVLSEIGELAQKIGFGTLRIDLVVYRQKIVEVTIHGREHKKYSKTEYQANGRHNGENRAGFKKTGDNGNSL